jgi:hypothetical protein
VPIVTLVLFEASPAARRDGGDHRRGRYRICDIPRRVVVFVSDQPT